MTARFELFEDGAGQIRFRFIADTGQLIAQSEGFQSKRDVLEVLELLRSTALERYAIDMTITSAAAGPTADPGPPAAPAQAPYPMPSYPAPAYEGPLRQMHEDPKTTEDWEKDK